MENQTVSEKIEELKQKLALLGILEILDLKLKKLFFY